MGITLANNAHTTLSADASSTDTTIYVEDIDSFPTLGVGDYFYLTLERTSGAMEIVKVTQINASSFTVVRGQEDTIPISFSIGSRAELRVTVQSLEDQFTATVLAIDPLVGADIGVTVQAYDADLATWAGVTSSANGRSLVSAADYAAMRGLLDLEAGTDFYSIAAADAAFVPTATLAGITRGATLAAEGDLFTALGANFWRNGERSLYGAFASQYKGTNNRTDGASWLGQTAGGFNAFWLERSSQTASASLHGGIGLLGASRKSDRYIYTDGVKYPVWTTATVYAAGAIVGSRGKFYQTATGGTSGATPPTHTTGDASDDVVTWTFLDYSYTAPIGVAGAVLSDVVDGSGAWAGYFEAVRTSAGGTTYGVELDIGNEGSNVVLTPYNLSSTTPTVGYWTAAGRSASVPTNPSSAAHVILKNNQTFNTGIVFGYDAITSGGYAVKYAAISDHAQGWFNSSGQEVFALYSTATANNERTKIVSGNSKIEFYSVGGVMATISSGASAGTAADEHINLIANAAGTGYATVTSHGTASNLGLRLLAKGTENVYVSGVALRPITDDGTTLGTTAAKWSDLFLASGAVINFNDGNYTLTHSAGLLSASGGLTVSGVGTFSNATTGLSINSTAPRILWTDTDATATQLNWDMVASNSSWLFRTRSDADGAGATIMTVTRSGTTVGGVTFGAGLTIPGGTLITTNTALTNGAGAQAGTLTNAPAVGNPTKWIPINDNGTTRYIPAW